MRLVASVRERALGLAEREHQLRFLLRPHETKAARLGLRGVEGDLDVGGGQDKVLDNVSGRADLDIDKGGDLTASGLSGAPTLPAGERTHVVQAGDTVHSLARQYGVPTDAIRRANGLSGNPVAVAPRPSPARPAPPTTSPTDRYRVTATSLRGRSGPSTSNAQVGTVQQGEILEVESVRDGWAKIANGGYVSADFIQPLQPARYRVTATSLRVRSGPSTSDAQVNTVLRGDVLEVESVRDGWAKLTNGGYVSADFIEALPRAPRPQPQPQPEPQPEPQPVVGTPGTLTPGQTIKIPGAGPQNENVPNTGGAKTRIEDGSRATVELSEGSVSRDGRIRAKGFVSAGLRLRDAELRSGTLNMRLLAAARATLPRTAFEVGGPGPGFNLAEIKIPVRIDLSRGSRIHTMTSAGREMDIQFDKDGSYAEFQLVARYENGSLRIPELQEVDLLLHSNSAASFAGEVVDISGDKSVSFKGRLVMLGNGLDFMGDVAIISRGSDTRPALKIRW